MTSTFRSPRGHSPRVGLVLGGGGAVGAAFHAGALAAFEHDLGWDARRAEVIVGTSAGSIAGALLRLDVPPTDLAAIAVGAPARHASSEIIERVADRPAFAPMSLRLLIRAPRIPEARVLTGIAALWLRRGVSSAASLAMLLPEGR